MIFLMISFFVTGAPSDVDVTFISGHDLYQATAIQVDAKNRIFIVDEGNHRILCFDSTGTHLFSFGREGQGPGEFVHPTDIGFLSDGRLLVGDGGNRRVQIFDNSGQYLSMLKIPDQPVGQLLVLRDDTFALSRMAGSQVMLDMGEKVAHRFQIFDLQGRKKGSFGQYTANKNPLLEAMLNRGATGLIGDKVIFAGICTPELITYDDQNESRHAYPLRFVPKEPQAKMEQQKNADGTISFQMAVEADQLCTALAVISDNDILLLRKTTPDDGSGQVDDELIKIDTQGKLKKTYEGTFKAKAMAASEDFAYIIHELDDDVVVARIPL